MKVLVKRAISIALCTLIAAASSVTAFADTESRVVPNYDVTVKYIERKEQSNAVKSLARELEAAVPEYVRATYSDYNRNRYTGTHAEQKQALYDKLLSVAEEFWLDTSDVEQYPGYPFAAIQRLDVLSYGLTANEVKEVYFSFRLDNPIFYFMSSNIYFEAYRETDQAVYLYLMINDEYKSGSRRADYQNKIKEYIEDAQSELYGVDLSDSYTVAEILHDYVNDSLEYAAAENMQLESSHNIIGSIVNHEGVCEAYAYTYQILLRTFGVDCVVGTGMANSNNGASGPHAWNIVKMNDGKYYDFDTTWDDSGFGKEYFARGSNFFDKEHTLQSYGNDAYGQDFYICSFPEISAEDYIPEVAKTENKFILTAANVEGQKGDTVSVPIRIEENTGVNSLKFSVRYDPEILTPDLTKIIGYYNISVSAILENGVITFEASDEIKDKGDFAVINFTLSEDTSAERTRIEFASNTEVEYIEDRDESKTIFNSGIVFILDNISYIPGDINGDGDVSIKDVIRLQKYLNDSDTQVTEAVDVNLDGSINIKDVISLQKALNSKAN